MNNFTDWPDIVNTNDLMKSQELDQFLDGMGNEIDDLFNETLLGIQDLDVPTGFANQLQSEKMPARHSVNNSFSLHAPKHSRKISGTAIFGFENHNRELSIEFKNDDKSVSPVQLVKMASQSLPLRNTMPIAEEQEPKPKKSDDYLITNNHPKAYKFPPSPPASDSSNHPVNYSARYLQELNRMNQNQKDPVYVDDIEPLLETADEKHSLPMKFVPIPVQDPSPVKKNQFSTNQNTYLPPPSPPKLTHDSPEQNSPSPHPFTRESSPVNLPGAQSSPAGENYFYNPQFFSDDSNYFNDGYSSPVNPQSLHSSPLKGNFNSSPFRHAPLNNDDTVDMNETMTQLTPLKPQQLPMTPSRNKVVLEWSPIVSPSAKNNKDVSSAIRLSSPKKRIKKTSLLPPGELDRYFEGPDENKIFTCTYKGCGKKFTRRYNVRSHIQTHLSDRPFACVYCPKKFVRQHDLNRHIKGHLEARHCRCPCGKEFTRIDAMKKHRLRNICKGGISPEEAELLRSPEKCGSPLRQEHSPAKIIQDEENEMTNNLLLNMTEIPTL